MITTYLRLVLKSIPAVSIFAKSLTIHGIHEESVNNNQFFPSLPDRRERTVGEETGGRDGDDDRRFVSPMYLLNGVTPVALLGRRVAVVAWVFDGVVGNCRSG